LIVRFDTCCLLCLFYTVKNEKTFVCRKYLRLF